MFVYRRKHTHKGSICPSQKAFISHFYNDEIIAVTVVIGYEQLSFIHWEESAMQLRTKYLRFDHIDHTAIAHGDTIDSQ